VLRVRVTPTLLLKNGGLVKGMQFKNHKYVGDPINAVKIFNEKEVDELVFLDISATPNKREPNFDLISDIASEAFMPFAYGGGVKTVKQIEKLFSLGVEKVIINTEAFYNSQLICDASQLAGSQSIVVSIDVKKSLLGRYEVYVENGMVPIKQNPIEYAKKMQNLGAGELIINAIDREGTSKGYDIELMGKVSSSVDIPVVALGGAGKLKDFSDIVNQTRISAVAAGNFFIFHGKHKAVLISYPEYSELEQLFKKGV
jgi:imidazole glycerol-phosphate synthase subunit HisF